MVWSSAFITTSAVVTPFYRSLSMFSDHCYLCNLWLPKRRSVPVVRSSNAEHRWHIFVDSILLIEKLYCNSCLMCWVGVKFRVSPCIVRVYRHLWTWNIPSHSGGTYNQKRKLYVSETRSGLLFATGMNQENCPNFFWHRCERKISGYLDKIYEALNYGAANMIWVDVYTLNDIYDKQTQVLPNKRLGYHEKKGSILD
jgi:hypothetical protein